MPDVSSVHFDVPLTNVSIAYTNGALVAREVAREVTVRRQSDRYFVYDPERDRFRQAPDDRAPGTEAAEVDFKLSSDTYFCEDHALESALPDEERDNADSPLQPEIDRTEFLTDRLLLNQEIALAAKLRDHTVIPGVNLATASEQFTDDEVDPAAAIDAGRGAILAATQRVPNVLVLPHAAYTALRNHPKVTDRVKYTGGGAVGPQALAELFDVERVLVARAMKNVAPRGQAAVLQPVWGNDALLLHVPARPSLKSVAAALTFVWSAAGPGTRGVAVQMWREERRKATMIRVQKYYDARIVAPGAAYLLRNAV